jgi:Domain of unknown function (DUF4406)
MKPLVYVAGPVTSAPLENTHAALVFGAGLIDTGLVAPVMPHLTCFWQMVTPRSYETWLAYDAEILRRCDALLRLPGASPGADREVELARRMQLPIFDGPLSRVHLLEWAKERL